MVAFAQAVGGKARIVGGPFGSKLTQKDYRENGVPVIRGGNMSGKGRWIEGPFAYVSEEKFRTDLTPSAAHRGDIVVTQRGTLGQVAIIADDAPHLTYVVSQSQMAIDVDRRVADRDFVYYFLTSPTFRQFIEVSAIQTGVPHINLGLLRDVEVNWPAREEQRRIASILGALDDKIEVNRRMNETLEAMARAIFQDWFVAFGPTRAKMEGRPPYLAPDLWQLFPDRLDAEGKPEGWALRTLADVVSVLETGGRPRGGVSGYREGVPSIGAESIVGLGVFDYSKTKFVPRSFFDGMTKGRVESRDVLLYKDGGRPGEFEPHATLVGDGFPFEECAINEHVYRIRATPAFGQSLLFFALTSEATMAEMRLKGTGVAIPGLNSTQARSLTILVPSQAVAAAFNATTEPLISRILANCNESRTLATTRDLLLPRLMSGELRVKDAERLVETAA